MYNNYFAIHKKLIHIVNQQYFNNFKRKRRRNFHVQASKSSFTVELHRICLNPLTSDCDMYKMLPKTIQTER